MNRMQEQVIEFHKRFGHPIGETPDFRRAAFRARFILEEAVETVAACVGRAEAIGMLEQELHTLMQLPPKGPDFVEAIDGIGDSLYVQFGAAIEFGMDMEPVVDEIHRANMAKVGGATREDGKTLKPPGWQPPRIAEVIAAVRPLVSTYTCSQCGVASPKDEWGPGHVRCPKCEQVERSASEAT